MFDKSGREGGVDPLLAVLRSAGSSAIRPAIKQAFEKQVFARLEDEIDGPNPSARAGLMISLLFGFDSLRRIFGISTLTGGNQSQLHQSMVHMLRQLLMISK